MTCRRFIHLVCCLMLGTTMASAQVRIISREKLDSISNPPLAENAAMLSFDRQYIEAEPMTEDDAPKQFRYKFKNVSDSPVNIRQVTSSCSCAPATSDQNTVLPGDEASVIVTYYPKGHPGRFERKIFLYTEDYSLPTAILKLSVNVNSGADQSGLYKETMGKIRLRSREVKVQAGRNSVERLKFLNVSGNDLKLQVDRMLLPPCLQFRTEPEVVGDGKEGEIVVTFNPDIYSQGRALPSLNIILKDMGLPPSQSSIKVIVEK